MTTLVVLTRLQMVQPFRVCVVAANPCANPLRLERRVTLVAATYESNSPYVSDIVDTRLVKLSA
jgi:hypothetical protein